MNVCGDEIRAPSPGCFDGVFLTKRNLDGVKSEFVQNALQVKCGEELIFNDQRMHRGALRPRCRYSFNAFPSREFCMVPLTSINVSVGDKGGAARRHA